jgi:hypothetical protein
MLAQGVAHGDFRWVVDEHGESKESCPANEDGDEAAGPEAAPPRNEQGDQCKGGCEPRADGTNRLEPAHRVHRKFP